MTKPKAGLAHLVFFTLKERTADAREAFVAACHTYLSDHPGVKHYSAGLRGESYVRPVNDQQFDVALVLVFASEADHDAYQVSPRHKQFLAEQSSNWDSVRIFDALV